MWRNRSTKAKAVSSKEARMALSLTKNPSNNHQDSETALISPKSILDTKNSPSPSAANNPFDLVKNPSNSNKTETEGIGLALIDSLNEEKKSERMALFGSNLKVQIPPVEVGSPLDFGIKTRNSHVSPARHFSRQLSLKEMEQSEDYTCVITHGPNPKTIHIFDDCILDNMESAFQSSTSSHLSPLLQTEQRESLLQS